VGKSVKPSYYFILERLAGQVK